MALTASVVLDTWITENSKTTMVDFKDYNPDINHHIKPFRERKLGRTESFDLVMYKYIRLEYVLNMLETRKLRFDNIKKWEDVYENFVDKEDIILLNSKRETISSLACYGQSWTTLEESDAMWRIYSPTRQAVRVSSTYPLIRRVFWAWNKNHKDNLIIPTIDYVFYAGEDEINKWLLSNTPINHWAFLELQDEGLFIKRLEFEHEREVRVVFSSYKDKRDFVEIDFDPHQVFREIVIDPRVSEDEFVEQRDNLIARGFDGAKIRKSTLYDFKKVKLEVDMCEPCDFPIIVYDKDGKPHEEPVFMNGPDWDLMVQ